MTGLDAYCAGYSAACTSTGFTVLPRGLTEGQEGCWIMGLIDAFGDVGPKREARFEPKVAAILERARANGDRA